MKQVQLFKIYWPDNGGGIASVMDMVSHAFETIGRDSVGNGYDQEIVVCRPYPWMQAKTDKYNGVKVCRCRQLIDLASTPLSFQFLSKGYRETKDADIVVYHFPYPMVDIGILFGLYHGKLIVWWHCDFDTQKGKILTKLYAPLVRHTLKKADAIIVSAKGNIKGSKILWEFRKKCTIIPFAISDDLAEEGRTYYEKYKERNSEEREKVHILFIGRFVWYKGLDVLINAFEKIDRERYELVLIGNGPLLEDIKTMSKQLKLQNITFTGSVSKEEKIKWIKWSDFLVLPSVSKAEAFAIVQIEAMAFGKPVINTHLPSGVPDVCPDGIGGITVEPGNVAELTEAMKRLGEDIELRKRYADNAIDLVEKKYIMLKFVKKYQKLLEVLARD